MVETLDALRKSLCSILSTYMVAHNLATVVTGPHVVYTCVDQTDMHMKI